MPSTVKQVFEAVGLKPQPAIRWGAKPSNSESGVYIVSLSESQNGTEGTLPEASLDPEQFKAWMAKCPDLLLDGMKPTVEQLMERIRGFWLPDEVILYIGLATSLRSRLGQYYSTPIGARRPHSGGYFLKLLSNLNKLWVHYAEADDPKATESSMLEYFCSQVSKHTRDQLFDAEHPFPFANLEWPARVRKNHGVQNARESGGKSTRKSRHTNPKAPIKMKASNDPCRTQPVTAADIKAGQIRVPARKAAATKSLFPDERASVNIVLRGKALNCKWDPRDGPDKERSGIIRIGRQNAAFLQVDVAMSVSKGDGGAYIIQ